MFVFIFTRGPLITNCFLVAGMGLIQFAVLIIWFVKVVQNVRAVQRIGREKREKLRWRQLLIKKFDEHFLVAL